MLSLSSSKVFLLVSGLSRCPCWGFWCFIVLAIVVSNLIGIETDCFSYCDPFGITGQSQKFLLLLVLFYWWIILSLWLIFSKQRSGWVWQVWPGKYEWLVSNSVHYFYAKLQFVTHVWSLKYASWWCYLSYISFIMVLKVWSEFIVIRFIVLCCLADGVNSAKL